MTSKEEIARADWFERACWQTVHNNNKRRQDSIVNMPCRRSEEDEKATSAVYPPVPRAKRNLRKCGS